jgi:hypothetical protein
MARREMSREMTQITGQMAGSPERPCPVVSLRTTPFFWQVKVRTTNVAAWRSGIGQARWSRGREPIHSDGCAHILAGAQKKEEAERKNVGDSEGFGRCIELGKGDGVAHECGWQRLDTRRWIIVFCPCLKKIGQARVGSVVGVHAHCASADALAAGAEGAGADASGEDLQERDCIAGEVPGIDGQGGTERDLAVSGGVAGSGALSRDAIAGCCLNSAPISSELTDGVSYKSSHGDSCG